MSAHKPQSNPGYIEALYGLTEAERELVKQSRVVTGMTHEQQALIFAALHEID